MLDNTCISVCVIHILYVFHIIVHVLRCHDLPRSPPSRYCHVIFVMKPSVELTDVVPEIGTEFYCISSLVRFVLFRVGHRIGFCRTQDRILSKYFRLPLHVTISYILNSQRSNDGIIELQAYSIMCCHVCSLTAQRV